MFEKTKTLFIGLFVIAACSAVVWLLLFMHPSVGDMTQELHVYFANVDRVSVGTRVTFAGRPVGEVLSILPLANARQMQPDANGHVYFYDVTLGLDEGVTVFSTDQVVLQTSGLMGERNIAILPAPIPKGTNPVNAIQDHLPLRGHSGDPMQETFVQLNNVADKVNKMMDTINDLIDRNRDDLSHTIDTLEKMVTHLDTAIVRANDLDLVGTVQAAAHHFGNAMQRTDTLLKTWEDDNFADTLSQLACHINHIAAAFDQPDQLREIVQDISLLAKRLNTATESLGPALDSFSKAATSAEGMAAKGSQILDHIIAGKGTVGHLLYDDTLYMQMESSIDKVSVLMDDINQYGLLFHLNKSWQRERMQRMAKLNDLSSVSAFQSYFDTELDRITASLERLTALLNKASSETAKKSLRRDPEIANAFGDLLRRVDTLEDTLRLYNQKLFSKPAEN